MSTSHYAESHSQLCMSFVQLTALGRHTGCKYGSSVSGQRCVMRRTEFPIMNRNKVHIERESLGKLFFPKPSLPFSRHKVLSGDPITRHNNPKALTALEMLHFVVIASERTRPRAKVFICSVLEEVLSFPSRAESLFYLHPVRSYRPAKLTEWVAVQN